MQRPDILCNFLQLPEVQVFGAAHKLLEFLGRVQVEEHFTIEEAEEALPEVLNLHLALLFKEELNVKTDELLAVFLGYKDVLAAVFELLGDFLAEDLAVDGEGASEHVFKWLELVVVQYVAEALRYVGLPHFEVIHIGLFVKQQFVTRRQNRNVQDHLIARSETKKSADEFEFQRVLKCLSIKPIETIIRIVHEHTPIWIKKLFKDELEIFFLDSSLINGWFTFEIYSHWLSY